MSDFESFGGVSEGQEAYDPASFERFKQRMAAASAQIAALQKQEKRQKKSEDELVRILMKFLQSGQKDEIIQLVSRLLELNVPSGFIVSVLLISNLEMQVETGLHLLGAGVINTENEDLPEIYVGNNVMPLKIKIAIIKWTEAIKNKSFDNALKLLKTIKDEKGELHHSAVQLATFCLRDFMEEQNAEYEFDQIKSFAKFILMDIIQQTENYLDNQKELGGGNALKPPQ